MSAFPMALPQSALRAVASFLAVVLGAAALRGEASFPAATPAEPAKWFAPLVPTTRHSIPTTRKTATPLPSFA